MEYTNDERKETVLEAISIDGLIKALTEELHLSTKESIFYQKKVELLKQAIEKLKS